MDFSALMRDADLHGVLDPAPIAVVNVATGDVVPHALEGFQHSDKGRVEWVIVNPKHREYEIRFRTLSKRPPLRPNRRYIPLIRVGDPLRYNAGEGRPFASTRSTAGLMDMNGDAKLRDELLNVEIFDTLFQKQVLVQRWRKHYNTMRPHSSLNYRPPAPEARQPWAPGLATLGPPPRAAWTHQGTAQPLVALVGQVRAEWPGVRGRLRRACQDAMEHV